MLDPQTSALLAQFGYDPATIESILAWAVYLSIVAAIAAIPTGMIARRKGRSVAGWVVFALCIPILPLLVVWRMPGRKDKAG